MQRYYLITHPNVAIDPLVPVPDWPLSPVGRQRMLSGLRQPWIAELTAIYSSAERKAMEGAEILSRHLGIAFIQEVSLGENDRSSTGFLPPSEFERVADEFFTNPEQSVHGWERAIDAQKRIVDAIHRIHAGKETLGSIAIVAHGAVGTLLYCHLAGIPISRRWDQPATSGGNYFSFTMEPRQALSHWLAFDVA